MLKLLLLASSFAFGGGYETHEYEYETGDIIGHTSKSSQSKMIQWGTWSKYSHVGVIIIRNNKPYVLEASSTVKYTPLKKWIKRGEGEKYTVVRYNWDIEDSTEIAFGLTDNQKKAFKKSAKKYVGKKYDSAFKWSDDKIYCSELVWKIYKDVGIEVSETKTMKSFNLWIPPIKREMQRRWNGKLNENEKVVAPKDVMKSYKFTGIKSTY